MTIFSRPGRHSEREPQVDEKQYNEIKFWFSNFIILKYNVTKTLRNLQQSKYEHTYIYVIPKTYKTKAHLVITSYSFNI